MSPFFEASIKPRFSETDMRGHINNTVIPVWLADGRAALFREELGSQVPTMVVNLNVDFSRELWQNDQRCVQAHTTVVTLDSETRKLMRVPDHERTLLAPYQVNAER